MTTPNLFSSCTPVGYWRWSRPPGATRPELEAAWSKLESDTAGLPSPVPGSCALSSADRARLIDYLRAERHLRQGWCGWSECRLCGRVNGSEDVSDGRYAWPSGLHHYVEAHLVALPEAFVAHVLRGGSVPEVVTRDGWAPKAPHEELTEVLSARGLHATRAECQAHLDRVSAEADGKVDRAWLDRWEVRRVRCVFRGDLVESTTEL